MNKRALLIGIDEYEKFPRLRSSVADAMAMRNALERNYDGSPNYACELLGSRERSITRAAIRSQLVKLFGSFKGDALFYFSGHGYSGNSGVFLVTQDGDRGDPGLEMSELIALANTSEVTSILLILDCCAAGDLGAPPPFASSLDSVPLREGLTMLAAYRPSEPGSGKFGEGNFTHLILEALNGAAADIRGRVSVAAIYAFVEQFLGAWDQRPIYRSHADHLPPVRFCRPAVPDALLRELPALFAEPESLFKLDPSFELSHQAAKSQNVLLFDKLKILRNAGLVVAKDGKDLYFTALEGGHLQLTHLGQLYWQLARRRLL